MAVWKILVIGVLAFTSLGLALATVAIPIAQTGGQRWLWLGGLLAATAGAGSLLTVFMRYAGASLDVKPRGARH